MKELYKALAAFQAEVPNIYKNAKGYNYKFADLGEINEIIKPLLSKNGLGYAQPLSGASVKTILYHIESGESLESTVNIPQGVKLNSMNDFQVMGSAITYLRRYSLSSMLGLITDEDADAAGEQVKPKEIRDRNEEVKGGSEPMGVYIEPDSDDNGNTNTTNIFARAKDTINRTLEAHNYTLADQKKTFITGVIQKPTIDNLDDAEAVMDALENEA